VVRTWCAARVFIINRRTEDRSAVFGNPELGLSSGYALQPARPIRLLETIEAEITGFYKGWNTLLSVAPTVPAACRSAGTDGKGRSSERKPPCNGDRVKSCRLRRRIP